MKKTDQKNLYQIKPKPKDKFKPNKAKEQIKEFLNEKLSNQKYSEVAGTNKEMADMIKYKLKEMQCPRYKYFVQVTIGEQKGQGVQVGGKCFWDYETDFTVSEQFANDYIFCLVIVYAVYLY